MCRKKITINSKKPFLELIKIGQMGPPSVLTSPAGSSDTIADSHRNRVDRINHETSNSTILPDYTDTILWNSNVVNSV